MMDSDELQLLCKEMGQELKPEDEDAVMAKLDVNGDGRISFEEFCHALLDEPAPEGGRAPRPPAAPPLSAAATRSALEQPRRDRLCNGLCHRCRASRCLCNGLRHRLGAAPRYELRRHLHKLSGQLFCIIIIYRAEHTLRARFRGSIIHRTRESKESVLSKKGRRGPFFGSCYSVNFPDFCKCC